MSRDSKLAFIIIGAIAVSIIGNIVYSSWRDNRLEKETVLRTESEMRFKQLAKEVVALKLKRDSLTVLNKALDSIISEQQNNPTVIIRKTNEIHVNLDNLSTINSIVLFSNNTEKLIASKNRYRLLRFDKGH